MFDRFYRINPAAVKVNPFGVRLPAADVFNAIEELKVFIIRLHFYWKRYENLRFLGCVFPPLLINILYHTSKCVARHGE